jgi:hypothetical protein
MDKLATILILLLFFNINGSFYLDLNCINLTVVFK